MFEHHSKDNESKEDTSAPLSSSNNKTKYSLWKIGLLAVCLFIALLALGLGILNSQMSHDLPDYSSLNEYTPPQMSRVLDRQGQQLGRFFEVRRTIVPFNEISSHMIHALLSAEDADFYEHQGLDYWGMLRAIYNSLKAGRLKGSGSTITQQTVKIYF